MPADSSEIEEGEAEGVNIHPSLSTVRLLDKNGKVDGIECAEVTRMRFDESGLLELETAPGVAASFPADTVIFAIGQVPDLSVFEGIKGLKFSLRNTLEIDPDTLSTGVEAVYAGGDVSTSGGSVIEAIAFGKKASISIDRFLGGTGNMNDINPEETEALLKYHTPDPEKSAGVIPPVLPVAERIKSMEAEVVKGIDRNAFEAEAKRCLNCGCTAVNSSDTAIALTALDAVIVTSKKSIPIGKLYGTLGIALDDDEIITEVRIPVPAPGAKQKWIKFRQRKELEFATVSVASVITVSEGKVSDARIVIGAVAPMPYRATGAEDIIKGKAITGIRAALAGDAAVKDAVPLSHNAYKIQIARALVKRAITD